MKRLSVLAIATVACSPFAISAQEAPANHSDAPPPAAIPTGIRSYSPPTADERFKNYLRQTFGIASFLEVGARAGINQARNKPSEWPQGAEGYGERFGSAMGEVIVRHTTEFTFGALFKEDLRSRPCRECSVGGKVKTAFADTFTARKGADGHRAFSVARIVGPFSGSLVATNTWYPSGQSRAESFKGVGLTFGLVFVRNVVRELVFH